MEKDGHKKGLNDWLFSAHAHSNIQRHIFIVISRTYPI